MKLQDMLNELVGREGGYVNDPADKGGETNWGITIAVARAFGYTGDMRSMPRDVAVQIYTERYWTQPRFNKVASLSTIVAEELLDTGVNMGTSVAGRFLQRALNVLNQEGKLFPDIAVDGNIGKMTIASLGSFLKARGKDGETVLLRMLNAQQSVRYMDIAEGNASQERFVYGWQLNRVGGL
jgi:lysozyme family protein